MDLHRTFDYVHERKDVHRVLLELCGSGPPLRTLQVLRVLCDPRLHGITPRIGTHGSRPEAGAEEREVIAELLRGERDEASWEHLKFGDATTKAFK